MPPKLGVTERVAGEALQVLGRVPGRNAFALPRCPALP